ncbi:hypothetical protein PIB30_066403 [Stylosanthes scabra]|uniref:Uncharacterized protein n=1 Tax=Stylosanthes scabra TaxID=79078 RepID=A0ABU6YN18_9FABA|nr:hypothetical protein [Stylosanthes scabra]
MAVALCFQLCLSGRRMNDVRPVLTPTVICNGKEFLKKSLIDETYATTNIHYFVLCFTCDYFVNQFCQVYRFELVLPGSVEMKVQSSGARWLCNQDIQDFKEKSGTKTSKRKATFDLNMNIIPPSSPSRNKMLMVSPSLSVSPLEEEEEEHAAIAENGFYLYHVSPKENPRGSNPPELLPLFPLHSDNTSSS